ncbi:DeoR/GlpR family DNA-binding transcription regulator [Rhodococcus olei]|uniref:DeoR/GlpR family DNA-binding transcription regulator n=1 Tax=Rhodococcus olei TaxID=2161675 RepID=A0ABP8PKQ4_9NOCA
MSADARRREILRRLASSGYLEAKALSAELDVDASTIRRDLDALARDGRVERTHGGARVLDGAVKDVPYVFKVGLNAAEKSAIARAAAGLVHDGASVILDSGSTTYEVAVALQQKSGLTVITNDLRIAKLVAGFPEVRLLVAGGELLNSVYTLTGSHTVDFIRSFSADWAFLGADAIDPVAGVTNTNTLEVPVKRAMMRSAAHVAVVADHSKFGRRALAKVAEIEDTDRIITDATLAADLAEPYGTKLVVAQS